MIDYASDSIGFGVGDYDPVRPRRSSQGMDGKDMETRLSPRSHFNQLISFPQAQTYTEGKEQITMRTETKPVDFLDKIRTRGGSKARRFLWHFLELQVPMGLGALICYLLGRLVADSSSLATVYHPGTYLFAIGDVLYLAVPVMVWMVFRGRGWRHSLEMAVAMSVPVAAIMVLGQLMAYDYLTWLITAGYPAMSLGMLIYMLYRRDYFTGRRATGRTD